MKAKTAYNNFKNNGNPLIINDIIEHIPKAVKSGRKSQFKLGKYITSFSISPTIDDITCRQFYTTSNGLLAYVVDKNKFLYFKKRDINVGGCPSRIAPDGTRAINARVDDSSKYDRVISARFNKILKDFI